jgi:hypothetical protein
VRAATRAVGYDQMHDMADRAVSRRNASHVGVFWFAGALILYWVTGARGLIWADPSKLTLYALAGYFPSLNPGDHAGWTVVAWSWLHLVGGDAVVAAHRLSAVAGALTVGFAAVLMLVRSGDRARANTGAALLLVALPVWWAAAVAESYAPALAATLGGALVLRVAARGWRWWAAGLVWGLAVAMHAMSIFLIIPLAWEAVGTRAWRLLPGVIGGSAPLWLAVFGGPRDPLTGFAASGASTWRWHWEAFLTLARVPRNFALLAALLLYALGVLAAVALWRGRRERRGSAVWAWSLGGLSLLLLVYAPFRLHLMVVFLLVGLVLALPVQLSPWGRAAHVVFQAAVYVAVPAVLTVAGRQNLGVRVLPDRNNAFYFLCPFKAASVSTQAPAKAAPTFAQSSLRSAVLRWARALDPGTRAYLAGFGVCVPAGAPAVVLADFNPGAVLRLAQAARGWRPEFDIRPVAVDVALGAPDPVAALAAEVGHGLATGGEVLLADSYGPYYHPRGLTALFNLSPCGTAVGVTRHGPATVGEKWPS